MMTATTRKFKVNDMVGYRENYDFQLKNFNWVDIGRIVSISDDGYFEVVWKDATSDFYNENQLVFIM